MSIVDKPWVLVLNAFWQPIGFKLIRHALVDLCSPETNIAALDIRYSLSEDGIWDFNSPVIINPIHTWQEWLELPIEPYHDLIRSPSISVRAPTVIIAKEFRDMPKREIRGTKSMIYTRDGGICQYSKRKLSYREATLDHIIPKSRWSELGKSGDPNQPDNLVLCDKKINNNKGNKLNEEVGLKLDKHPTNPKPIPYLALIREAKHRDWSYFLLKNEKKKEG